ncbi:selenocysteine-specific translation elongation factor [Aquincola sp. J276]|uniref:selenocysteine-specific translation elongation factor n=1 Tax=Aquincola sp. J276 TaxID=2898432 RepID=UPI002151136A|nr:selenocysteine-specific translation elongation factor [Aquincola sp. J276]MCR5864806.1 selenocysteine-specific translation elongation factor [Aquincola sp. J276]
MIIGTAGHIDHGKTTLVRALTGVDTDRLPEEKRRGISIELGYAYLPADDGQVIGFVDVPGHERLLHTMLAGATGIDHLLLLVAADDGVMPQTREHLAVAALLGLSHGTVALTKADRVDAARLQQVHTEVQALLAPTPLAGAPAFEVSATTGIGVDELRRHLLQQAAIPRAADARPAFRLAIDRAFTLAGTGTVVTGSVHAGAVSVGDELRLVPGDRLLRVRSLHAQNQPAQQAAPGQRCAVALAGIEREAVGRGQWLCAPEVAQATERMDVRLQLWPGEARPLRSGTTVHLHLGTADVLASVALLDVEALQPGGTALAQLVLRAPVGAWHGDRGVLRDATASRTVAGITVLDAQAPARYRRTPERLQWLAAAALPDAAPRLQALLQAAPQGLDLSALARGLGWRVTDLPLPAEAVCIDAQARAVACPAPGGQSARAEDTGHLVAIASGHLQALQQRLVDALAALHAQQPDEIGPDPRRFKRLAAPRMDDLVFRHALDALVAEGRVVRSGHWLHLPAHAARLSEAEEKLVGRLMPAMLEGGFDPPWARDLAKLTSTPEPMVRLTLANLSRRGQAFAVVKDLYYPLPTIERLAGLARQAAAGPQGLCAASFRDATGLGRKRAIQLLEFFDRVGFTRRVKDLHVLRPDAALFDGGR